MENELFIKRLQELAEVKRLKPPRHPNLREADSPEPVFRNGYEFVVTKDDNPTLSYEIVKLKPIVKDCEDCGKCSVENRSVQKKLYSFPYAHWRESCGHCKLTKDPETGEFSIPNNIVNPFFVRYLNSKK